MISRRTCSRSTGARLSGVDSNVLEVVTDETRSLAQAGQSTRLIRSSPSTGCGSRCGTRTRPAVTVAHLVIGVDVECPGHGLGVWIAEGEGATFWHSVLTALRHRGAPVISSSPAATPLSGLPEAITSVFPDTVVQTCIVHVVRGRAAVRVLPGSHEGRGGDAPDLHRAERGGRRTRG